MSEENIDDALVQMRAKVLGWTPKGLINDIESVEFHRTAFLEWCRTVKAELLPGLSRIMREEQGQARLNASLLLLHLGESVGTNGIIAALREEDPEFQIRVLSSVSVLPFPPRIDDERPRLEKPVSVNKEALYVVLEPFLEPPKEKSATSRESRAHYHAVNIALKLNLPEAESRIRPLLYDGINRVRSLVLSHQARHGKDSEALDIAEAMLAEAGPSRLQRALAERDLRRVAAREIAKGAFSRHDKELETTLIDAARDETRAEVLSEIISALIAIKGDLDALPREVANRLQPPDVMRIYWRANDITLRDAVKRMVDAGIITAPTPEKLQETEEKWQRKGHAYYTVISFLLDRIVWFDTESGFVPPDYLNLLSRFIIVSQPVFDAEDFSQEVDEPTGNSTIRFTYVGKSHAFTTQNYGDYYDVDSVLDGLNQALAEAERPERFLHLYSDDQTSPVLFASEAPFRQVAEALYIPIQEDRTAAMQQGIAYEQRVFEVLKKEASDDKGIATVVAVTASDQVVFKQAPIENSLSTA